MVNKATRYLPYIIASVFSFSIMAFIHGLWRIDIRIPFVFVGDALFHNFFVKNAIDSDLFLRSDMFGAPFGIHFFDFPSMAFFDVLLIRTIGLFSGNWAVVINSFYFLTYPLTAAISVFVIKRMGLSNSIAVLIGVLYSILPYHFYRNIGHLNLTGYYFIPFIALLVYLAYIETDGFFHSKSIDGKLKINFRSKNFRLCIIISACLGMASLYYAFFAVLTIVLAIVVVYGMERNIQIIKLMSIFVVAICCTVILVMIPSIVFIIINGPNPDAVTRNPDNFNLYSLTISHLLMPIPGHVSGFMQNVREVFQADNSLVINENSNSTLGIIGGLGFISSFFFMFWNLRLVKNDQNKKVIKLLSILIVTLFVIATYGGFGQLIFLLIGQIRAYNRLSLFIAFFSLIIVGIFLQELTLRLKNRAKHIMTIIITALLLIGVFDASSSHFRVDQRGIINQMENIEEFVSEIESIMPSGAMVFQLPYTGNNPLFIPAHNVDYYTHFRPLLASDTLRWSYGAPYGRPEDYWQRYVSSQNHDRFLDIISFAGFEGVYVDTHGYIDDGDEIKSVFEYLTGSAPVTCRENRYIFFDIRNYADNLMSSLSQNELRIEKARAMQYVIFSSGFYYQEIDYENNWRWSSKESRIEISVEKPSIFTFSAVASTLFSDYSYLKISFDGNENVYTINAEGTMIEFELFMKTGRNIIKFETDAQKANIPNDMREMHFKITNPSANLEIID